MLRLLYVVGLIADYDGHALVRLDADILGQDKEILMVGGAEFHFDFLRTGVLNIDLLVLILADLCGKKRYLLRGGFLGLQV